MIIGIGLDLVEVKRIRKLLKHSKNSFLKRVFTTREISYLPGGQTGRPRPACAGASAGRRQTGAQSRGKQAEHLAARFAAKEAFLKAVQTGWGTKHSPLWQEIETRTRAHGQPYLALSGKAKRICKQLKVKQTLLSLTHTKDYALALVILER